MASSSSLPLSIPSPCLSRNWEHSVFPSFHGPDVRTTFLSHVLREFKEKGISPFIDNNIKRGESIGPELIRAIRGSKILIVFLSRRYASSSWCLDELVEIMNKTLGQTVMTIFYNLNPTDVKKQTGYFGKVFEKTCEGKTEEKIQTWKEALEGVATIAGYHFRKGVDEAAMIEKIAVDISNMLNIATPSQDFRCVIGMGAHMGRIESLLRLDLDAVRMIGIWGPPGIGKSTIARFLFNRFSNNFQLKLLMVDIKEKYPRTCLNEVSVQLKLQRKMLSKMLNHKVKAITDLGVARERLNDKKVFLVLDEVDRLAQLVALAGEKKWFGLGSRIIIISENQRVLKAQGVDDIYKVGFPTTGEAFQMFCKYAFGQKYPKDGFEVLARVVTSIVSNLPLGLKVMGSHFGTIPKEEWKEEIARLRSRLDGEIGGVLKFSYDALDDEEQSLFLHIACFFHYGEFEKVVEYLEKTFPNVRRQLRILYDKSLISIEDGWVVMHHLLRQLGRYIVRKQSHEPGKRQFLDDGGDINEVLNNDAADIRSVIGIDICLGPTVYINERAFEGMSNLEFLRVDGVVVRPSHGPIYLSPKLRLLRWTMFPMTCLPSPLNLEFLVELYLPYSKLEKLWEENKSIRNLKRMDLSYSKKLKELPNLSTATSLKELQLDGCLSLVKLPFSIGRATNLEKLNLKKCSSLVKLPSSIGNAINLKEIHLTGCSTLKELPFSMGKVTNLQKLDLTECSRLVKLSISIGNATNLQILCLNGCSSLVELSFSIGNATNLQELDLRQCSSLVKLPSSIRNATNLQKIYLKGCSSLVEMPFSIGNVILISSNFLTLDREVCSSLVEMPFSIGNVIVNCCLDSWVDFPTRARGYLDSKGYSSLLQIPSFIWNAIELEGLDFSGCSSFVEVSASIGNLHKLDFLVFKGCSKLEVFPVNINLKSLNRLDLSGCSSLKTFPEISTNISYLDLSGTAIDEVPSSIRTWYRLEELILEECKNLFSLPQLPQSLWLLNAVNCESLERLDCFCRRSYFSNCFKLNKDARDLIIQSSTSYSVVLPGKEIPTYFTHRANGGTCLVLKLNERPFPSKLKFKACILLVSKNDIKESDEGNEVEVGEGEENDGEDGGDRENDVEDGENDVEDGDEENVMEYGDEENDVEDSDEENDIEDSDEDNGVEDNDEEEHDVEDSDADNDSEYSEDDGVSATVQIVDKHNRSIGKCNSPYHYLHNSLAEHLYIFEFHAYVHVISHELFIKFSIDGDEWVVKECGVNYEDCEADSLKTEKSRMDDNGDSSAITDISKYTNNSETGCSKSKVTEMSLEKNVIKATHEHGEENTVHIANALISSEISVFPSVVGISGVCEAEENVNGNSSVEKKKRKKQIPTMDTERTSEVGNNGDCEANKEVCENDSAKIKKRRVSFSL